jgi:hypothetical protein
MNIFSTPCLVASTLLLVFATSINAQPDASSIAPTLDESALKAAKRLIETALDSSLGYEIVASLTTEVGPRLAGSEAEQRARDWGVKLGEKLSFDRVSVEPFTMPFWDRGELQIALTKPYQQDLYGTALGGSGMSGEPIDAPVVYFRSIAEIEAVTEGELSGKIAFIDGELMVQPIKNGVSVGGMLSAVAHKLW